MIDQGTLKKFNEIYEKTYDDVLKYVICHCSNIDDVQDICQNIYLDVLKLVVKLDDNYKAYIMGIAKNKIKDYYRFNYKVKIMNIFQSKEELDNIDVPADIDIEKQILDKYDVDNIWSYLKSRPVIISKIFYLHYYLGLTIKEVAQELDIGESNIKNYLYRTLRELKSNLESESDNYGKK